MAHGTQCHRVTAFQISSLNIELELEPDEYANEQENVEDTPARHQAKLEQPSQTTHDNEFTTTHQLMVHTKSEDDKTCQHLAMFNQYSAPGWIDIQQGGRTDHTQRPSTN